MLKDAKEGNIDCVMVYKTNRLARNTSDLLKIVEDLHKQNVEFFSSIRTYGSQYFFW